MRPYITLTSVDLPPPFSPRSAWISAGNRSRSMPSLARKEPYRLVMPIALNSGSVPNEAPCGGTSCIEVAAHVLQTAMAPAVEVHFQADIMRQNPRQQKEENNGKPCQKRRQATAAPIQGAPCILPGAGLHRPDLL